MSTITREEERALVEKNLTQHRRTLANLELKAAMYSPLERPVSLLSEIDAEKKEIQDIEEKLQQLNKAIEAEAQKRRQLARLYSQGMACFVGGDWVQAIYLLQQILDIDKDYKDTLQKMSQSKRQDRLEHLYSKARQGANGDWQAVITLCREIIGIAPFYRDVQWLLWKARFHSARQHAGAIWARYKTAIGMLAVLLLMAAGIPVLRGWMIVWQPTPTPPTVQVSEEEFVIEINGVRIDASDDRCREIVCNSSPRIQVTVMDSTGVPLQPDIFSYNWCFDPPDPHNPDRLDSKNYATIYSVPCDRNNQTVTVEVLKNGKTLSVRGVCFNIKKQQ
jgi:tetratricopeptide (TPR) repeat protein